MTELLASATEENLNEASKVLKNLLHKASELNIFRIKICARFKS